MKRSPTYFVVGGLIGAALIAAAFVIAGWKVGAFLSLLLIYEAWTLVNSYANDTISEIVWEYSKRPMVPFLGGIAAGWGIAAGYLANPYLVAAVFFLCGHFWFQKQEKKEKKEEEK